MNQSVGQQVLEKQAANPVAVLRADLQNMEGQFKAALPAHIPVERFMRVVMTAIQNNPDLINKVDRRSLWNAAIKAAQDGLLPDGREGAIVPYNGQAQWMPMVAGIRKKVRNSGEIATWEVQVVHERDAFEFELGDEPFIKHKPDLSGNPGAVLAAYSIAVLKSGEKSREVMSIAAIEKVRTRSKSKSGPWFTDYEEMCRKTVARRHSKVLPMSTDLDDLLRRDDSLYDFDAAKNEAKETQQKTLSGRLDVLASLPSTVDPAPSTAPEPDDAAEQQPQSQNHSQGQESNASTSAAGGQPAPDDAEHASGAGTNQEPTTEAQYIAYANAWRDRLIDPTAGEAQWKAEKNMRNKCNMGPEARDELEAELKAKRAELRKAKE